MGTTYTSKITLRCWKQHTCAGCGGSFAYRFHRVVSGQASTSAGASAAAERSATNALKNDVDQHPCPTCGLFQADMLGVRRERAHCLVFFGLALSLFILGGIYFAQGLTPPTVSTGLAVVCLVALAAHFFIDYSDPNASLERNRTAAQRRQESGLLLVREAGRSEPPEAGVVPSGRSTGLWLALAGLGVAAFFVTLPEAVRLVAGWPANPGASQFVVGPGDAATIYLPFEIRSLNGFRRAKDASARAWMPGRLPVDLVVQARDQDWGQTISVEEGKEHGTSRVWVVLHFPPEADLADKTADVRIHLETEAPQMKDGHFEPIPQTFDHKVHLDLGGPEAGKQYIRLWLFGLLAACVSGLGASLFLILRARGVKKLALPTKILVDE